MPIIVLAAVSRDQARRLCQERHNLNREAITALGYCSAGGSALVGDLFCKPLVAPPS